VIDPRAVVGGPPFVYTRLPDGRRAPRPRGEFGVEVADDVDVFALAVIVNGTERPTVVRGGARICYRAQIGHDTVIGEHTVIGCGAIVCGFAEIGDRCTLGVGVIVTPFTRVGDDCMIGAGIVVSADVPTNTKITVNGTRRNWSDLPWSG